ncbi:MAG: SDR family oxidoreductase [Thermicanus sp.]|nr:SDR family oxidoreductase [Thermicanus sp.]
MIQFGGSVKDKVVVVTGGSGVLGSLFAEVLAENGAKVAVLGRTKAKVDQVVQRILTKGGIALPVVANVLDIDQLEEAKKEIQQKLGTCDILINGAGGNHTKENTTHEFLEEKHLKEKAEGLLTFFDLDPESVQYVFNLNFLGTLLPTQVFAKEMIGKKGATIINISSMNAFRPLTRIPAYSGAKAAISNFTQWLAVYFAKVGIRVNAIAPGFFLTEQNRGLLLHEDETFTDRAQKILQQTPMGRFGQPQDLIGTLLWLVDEKASAFVTGVVIPVDGGFNAYSGV